MFHLSCRAINLLKHCRWSLGNSMYLICKTIHIIQKRYSIQKNINVSQSKQLIINYIIWAVKKFDIFLNWIHPQGPLLPKETFLFWQLICECITHHLDMKIWIQNQGHQHSTVQLAYPRVMTTLLTWTTTWFLILTQQQKKVLATLMFITMKWVLSSIGEKELSLSCNWLVSMPTCWIHQWITHSIKSYHSKDISRNI